MEEEGIILERHEQRLRVLESEIRDLREVQSEIRAMNETLVMLTTELRHTNEHIRGHEKRLASIEATPRARLSEIVTALITALITAAVSLTLGVTVL